jgi:drug/metabolite transporter (DMT)-like permease
MYRQMSTPLPESADRPAPRPGLAITLKLLSVVTTALLAVMVKLATAEGAHSLEILFYRFALSVPLVTMWALSRGGWSVIATNRLGGHVVRGLFGMCALLGVFMTVGTLPLAEATTVLFTAPLIATVLSIFLLRESVGVHRWLAIVLGVIGMLIMMRPTAHHAINLAGVAMGLAAASMTAMSTISIRHLARTETATKLLFWFTLISTIATGAAMPFFAQAHDVKTWLILVAACLFGTAGQALVTSALRYAPVALLAPFEYSQLVLATLFGWIIFSDLPSLQTFVGAIFICGAGLYTFYREHLRRRPPIAESTTLSG